MHLGILSEFFFTEIWTIQIGTYFNTLCVEISAGHSKCFASVRTTVFSHRIFNVETRKFARWKQGLTAFNFSVCIWYVRLLAVHYQRWANLESFTNDFYHFSASFRAADRTKISQFRCEHSVFCTVLMLKGTVDKRVLFQSSCNISNCWDRAAVFLGVCFVCVAKSWVCTENGCKRAQIVQTQCFYCGTASEKLFLIGSDTRMVSWGFLAAFWEYKPPHLVARKLIVDSLSLCVQFIKWLSNHSLRSKKIRKVDCRIHSKLQLTTYLQVLLL